MYSCTHIILYMYSASYNACTYSYILHLTDHNVGLRIHARMTPSYTYNTLDTIIAIIIKHTVVLTYHYTPLHTTHVLTVILVFYTSKITMYRPPNTSTHATCYLHDSHMHEYLPTYSIYLLHVECR